ncbi:zinc finger protein CONSTANS-LIKE 5-like [Olea europaea var. sylvestris]|uniref:zinc finger protein CONSTANS-LIKE 5-like n=1 Tax=Olea europaea var. sylvestris TaxID=158386 RepID=UPI000C1D7575|nr:zinc finger protein CONSTANS-LIKE 5-like [Olea europaea var. sylvestris]
MGLGQDGGGAAKAKSFPTGWNVAARPCDHCKSAVALLFCRTDSAFMCMSCDSKVHDANSKSLTLLSSTSKHERVWMCEVCELAPASVTCKADAAALCITCDRDIHSANHLASRHERVPVIPFYDNSESLVKSTAAALLVPDSTSNILYATSNVQHDIKFSTQDSFVTDTWKIVTDPMDMKSMDFLFSEDQFLDLDYPISSHQPDSIVPVQTMKSPIPTKLTDHSSEDRLEVDFTRSNIGSYNNSYTTPSFSQSVSSSSLDIGVVPEGSSFPESSYSFGVDLSKNQGSQIVGSNREARVLRYREKRKNRKFEKTIRYASRKAYAETRPRIKGRFAKRTEAIESDIDRIFIPDERYHIVPTF